MKKTIKKIICEPINVKRIIIISAFFIGLGLVISLTGHNCWLVSLRSLCPFTNCLFSLQPLYKGIIDFGLFIFSISFISYFTGKLFPKEYENYLKRLNVDKKLNKYGLSSEKKISNWLFIIFVLCWGLIVAIARVYNFFCVCMSLEFFGGVCVLLLSIKISALGDVGKLQNHVREMFEDYLKKNYESSISNVLNETKVDSSMMVLMEDININLNNINSISIEERETRKNRTDFDFKISLLHCVVKFSFENGIPHDNLHEFICEFIKPIKIRLGIKFTDNVEKFGGFINCINDSYTKCDCGDKTDNHHQLVCNILKGMIVPNIRELQNIPSRASDRANRLHNYLFNETH